MRRFLILGARVRVLMGTAVGVAALLTLGAVPALADTTIGNSSPGGDITCGGTGEDVDNGYVVPPGGGSITSLSSSAYNGQFDLQVLRPNGDGTFTVVGNTGLNQLTTGGVETFPVTIPVSGGEVLGFYEGGGAGASCAYSATGDTLTLGSLASDPPVGSTIQLTEPYTGASLDVSANLATAAALTASGTPVSGVEGQPFSGQVATFSDTDGQPAGDYSATIDWGDGQSSAGTVSETATGQYSISGQHTYAEEGSHPVSVTINDSDGSTAQVGSTATVADAPLSATGFRSGSSPEATTDAFAGPVAQLSDQNPDGSAADFTATIHWGDGTSSSGTVNGTGGSYTVSGSHTYLHDGPYTVQVQIQDAGSATADTTTDLVVYGYANNTGGGFVIGDRDSGSQVYFWGPRWWARNPMSGGRAPTSFKGFATSGAQACGSPFTAQPGDRFFRRTTLPPYMAVAVTSSISRSRSKIWGTVEKLVVVKTDLGYPPHRGWPGTGQVVATICG